jgi:hypothetical protein
MSSSWEKMNSSLKQTIRFTRRAGKWVASSIFGLAGTMLLVCWLLAYTLEPNSEFARVGLVLAIAAYGADLVREEMNSQKARAEHAALLAKARTPSPAAKAA